MSAGIPKIVTWSWNYLELEILGLLPYRWSVGWLRFVGRARFPLAPRYRRMALQRMRAFLPQADAETVERAAREHLTIYTLKRRLSYLIMNRDARDLGDALDLRGWEHLEAALERGRGVVLLVSHVGLPRLLRWYLRSTEHEVYYLLRIGFPRDPDPRKQWFRDRLRARFRVDSEGLMGEEPFGLRYLKKAHDHLRRNGIVYVSGDGFYGGRTIPAKVCGRDVEIHLGGISLALTSGATILTCFSTLDSRARFRIEIQPPLSCPADAPRSEQLRALGTDYAARLEEHIRDFPTNVFREEYVPRMPGPEAEATTRAEPTVAGIEARSDHCPRADGASTRAPNGFPNSSMARSTKSTSSADR